MAQREYPNNITAGGSTVKECLENDDRELQRILNMIPSGDNTTQPVSPDDGTIWDELLRTVG